MMFLGIVLISKLKTIFGEAYSAGQIAFLFFFYNYIP